MARLLRCTMEYHRSSSRLPMFWECRRSAILSRRQGRQPPTPPARLPPPSRLAAPETHPTTPPACPAATHRDASGPAHLGAHRFEVHEPRLVEGSGDAFEGGVDAAVQLYLVVERAEDAGDATLFEGRGQRNFYASNVRLAKSEACNSIRVCVKLMLNFPSISERRKDMCRRLCPT